MRLTTTRIREAANPSEAMDGVSCTPCFKVVAARPIFLFDLNRTILLGMNRVWRRR